MDLVGGGADGRPPIAPLNPLDLKEPYIRVVPDGRVHVSMATKSKKHHRFITTLIWSTHFNMYGKSEENTLFTG